MCDSCSRCQPNPNHHPLQDLPQREERLAQGGAEWTTRWACLSCLINDGFPLFGDKGTQQIQNGGAVYRLSIELKRVLVWETKSTSRTEVHSEGAVVANYGETAQGNERLSPCPRPVTTLQHYSQAGHWTPARLRRHLAIKQDILPPHNSTVLWP